MSEHDLTTTEGVVAALRDFADQIICPRDNVFRKMATTVEKLQADNNRLKADIQEYYDTRNWRGAVTNQLQPNIPGDISRGRAVELLSDLRCRACRRFEVTNSERSGVCYSFYDHFEIHWDDGTHELWRAELSTDGTRKSEVSDE